MQCRRKIASKLLEELKRLESGNRLERQRYNNAMTAMAKVMADPINPLFNKDLPENYKAVDVLQQYRMFFRVLHPTAATTVAHFVWMNDEDSLHRTGEPDDCYAVFADIVRRGEVEAYEEEAPPAAPAFSLSGKWGDGVRYASLVRDPHRADSFLFLNQITANSYQIQSITVSEEDMGLATALLERVCESASQAHMTLSHELFIKHEHAAKSRHILTQQGFTLSDAVDDVEVWTRNLR